MAFPNLRFGKMEGLNFLCRTLEKMCHLQVSLSSQASVAIVTSKRRTRHKQVTDKIKGKKKVFQRLEKTFSHLRKIIAERLE
jgi:hypothetical protein